MGNKKQLLNIATGKSRNETRWKNVSIPWHKLAARLKESKDTGETLEEYLAMSKDERGAVKDVGGFVGGRVIGGRKTRENIPTRGLLTLDADDALPDLWDTFRRKFPTTAAVMHSTHSHTPVAPRYRLIIPLAHEVGETEYQLLHRHVAETLGAHQFDKCGGKPTQMMFWPSHPHDVAPICETADGDFLPVEDIVREMTAEGMPEDIITRTAKAEDPTTKPGAIGAFCRVYTVTAAIDEFLPDIYTKAGPNRYTYTKGTTAGGLVIYGADSFAWSYHATDPAAWKLRNAFDLVRVHKFGHLDENVRKETPIHKLPSHLKMEELARGLEAVRAEMLLGNNDDLNDFICDDLTAEDLAAKFSTTENGKIIDSKQNALTLLQTDPRLRASIKRNELTEDIDVVKALPWREAALFHPWNDTDMAHLYLYAERFGLSKKDNIMPALLVHADNNKFHPIKDYFDSLPPWDGVKRVERLYIDFLGAEDNELNREAARLTFAAAVSRIYYPGCKFDYITTFAGPEGIGKTTLIERLGGKWYKLFNGKLEGKEAMETLLGEWLVDFGELSTLNKSEVEEIKSFSSNRTDKFRKAYGRFKGAYPRQCVFFSNTNKTNFLRGLDGNRRFWVIDCTDNAPRNIWDEMTTEEVGQVWAEARLIMQSLPISDDPTCPAPCLELSPRLAKLMRQRQEDHNEVEDDDRLGQILGVLVKNKEKPLCYPVIAAEMGVVNKDSLEYKTVRRLIKKVMTDNGWQEKTPPLRFPPHGQQRTFIAPPGWCPNVGETAPGFDFDPDFIG